MPFYQGKSEYGNIYPTPVKWCSKPKKIAKTDDILISVRAPVGPTNLCFEESCIGRGLAAIRPKDNMPIRYILYYMRLIEGEWGSKATGTTFKAITGDVLRKQAIPLAPVVEQERIVARIESLFTQLDAGVAGLKRAQAALRRYRASVLKAACEGRLAPQDPSDEPAEEMLKRILAEKGEEYRPPEGNLPELPEGWVWVRVGQLGLVSGGITKNQKRNTLQRKLPYLRVANVYSNELRLDDLEFIGVTENEIERVLLKDGDLLVVEGNGSVNQIGRVAIWNGSISPCIHQNHIIKVRFLPKELAKYVLVWLLSESGREQIVKTASSTSGLYTLSLSKVALLIVPLPPLPEQYRIVAEVERRLSVAQELEGTFEANLKRAARLRQAILKRAFEGRLV